uniref:Signal transducing adaptor family member 2 n=1 Tax=Chelonoidis abingdonii TaxID=106734 RepID=A0A8C0G5B7_CHEAB
GPMALLPPSLRGAKPKPSSPPHYYEGFLEKKGPQDKVGPPPAGTGQPPSCQGLSCDFGTSGYVEKIDLDTFVSLTDGCLRSGPRASDDEVGLNLKLRGQEVKLKAESLEAREMWKGFILTMVEMKVPSSLMLLPGHIYMMSEALSKEQERRAELSHCYFKVSRTEAQVLLERNPDCGNMLLRPGGDGKSISVTTRQMLNGTPLVKHYRVSRVGQQYVVDVEQPHHCSSLSEVVQYFVSNTKKTLVPLILDEDYSEKLGGFPPPQGLRVRILGTGAGFAWVGEPGGSARAACFQARSALPIQAPSFPELPPAPPTLGLPPRAGIPPCPQPPLLLPPALMGLPSVPCQPHVPPWPVPPSSPALRPICFWRVLQSLWRPIRRMARASGKRPCPPAQSPPEVNVPSLLQVPAPGCSSGDLACSSRARGC